jgi:guanine deaminase
MRRAHLQEAIRLAQHAVDASEGGPFGAVVVQADHIVGRGWNRVTSANDPTAHAEIVAIRDACRHFKSPHLTGAVIYSNFEPCPMCLAAIYWADIRSLFFCNSRSDAEKIGFMDKHLYHELAMNEDQREILTSRISLPEMELLMNEWMGLDGKKLY